MANIIWLIVILLLIVFVVIKFLTGVLNIILNPQKLITFVLIILFVLLDIFFIMPGCRLFVEAVIHLFIILPLPFIYLFKSGKKEG